MTASARRAAGSASINYAKFSRALPTTVQRRIMKKDGASKTMTYKSCRYVCLCNIDYIVDLSDADCTKNFSIGSYISGKSNLNDPTTEVRRNCGDISICCSSYAHIT